MPVTYLTLQTQIGALLRILNKIDNRETHARDANNANFDRRLLTAVNGFSTSDNEEARALAGFTAYLDNTEVTGLISKFIGFRSQVENKTNGLGTVLVQDLDASAADQAASFIDYEYDEALTDGTIAIKQRTGLLGALRRDMTLNGQFVVANVVTIGALTAASGNSGTLVATSATAEGHCPTGVLTIICIDDNVDKPQFSVEIEITTPFPDGTKGLEADNSLTPEKSFEDGETGLTTVLTRDGLAAPTETLDQGACFSATSFTTPKESDSNKGIFYIRTTRQALEPFWLIEFFSDAAFTKKRGQKTSSTLVGSETFTTVLNGGTSITTTFNRANAAIQMPAAGNTASATYDIRTPRRLDKWTRTLTNDDAGLFQTKTYKTWRFSFPTSGVSLWTDALASTISMP